jgi:PTH2 family peptidyl-tRNA hydrolase
MIKQVIVMRKDLSMRKGKMIAQGAHASMGALLGLGQMIYSTEYIGFNIDLISKPEDRVDRDSVRAWLEGAFTKICVGVDSEQELEDVYTKAREAGLPSALIIDSGLTEFGGVPTKTCCGIGPAKAEIIDGITGHLKLL